MYKKLPWETINILCSLEKLKHVFPAHTHMIKNTTYQGLVIGVSAHAWVRVCVMSVCGVYVHVVNVFV